MSPQKLNACMSAAVTAALTMAIFLLAMNAGQADHAPRYTADGLVIHGDWGLHRPGHVTPWVYGPHVIGVSRYGMGHYFPSNRHDPGAYRRRPAVDPHPVPAERYFRSWGAQSQPLDPNSATVYAPFEPPAVIYAPRIDGCRNVP